MSENRSEISQLGEFGLIDRISKKFQLQNPSSIVGIGDDAAVIDCGDYYQLVSTDLLAESVHFDLAYTPLQHLGFKAVSVNVSDIAAMFGKPSHIVVGIALSNRFSVEAIEELYAGMKLQPSAAPVAKARQMTQWINRPARGARSRFKESTMFSTENTLAPTDADF